MRWRDREGSDNVEDRRDESGDGGGGFRFPGGGGGFPGGRIPIPMGRGGGLGLFGVLVVFGLMLLFGIDPRVILDQGGEQGGREITFPGGSDSADRTTIPRTGIPDRLPREQAPNRETRAPTPPLAGAQQADAGSETEMKQFASVVLKTTEEVWTQKFSQSGKNYTDPKLVLYRENISSGCGIGVAQMGPFYCPLDAKVYIDLGFYDDLKRRFKVNGDFAQAYVIAHEVGHHVQTLLGITSQVERTKARSSERQQNALQVRMELQADCLAGIWAYYAQQSLKVVDPGDIDEALAAAAAIGDDRIQRRTQGRVTPDSFTHGSSEQRVGWFKRGFENGNFPSCDTFSSDL